MSRQSRPTAPNCYDCYQKLQVIQVTDLDYSMGICMVGHASAVTKLTKDQSSLLVQARTAVIGLRDFLFKQKVPGVPTPYCSCGEGRETVEHLVIWCPTPPRSRTWPRNIIRTHRDLSLILQGRSRNQRLLGKVLGWLMDSGRLLEYSLARKLELEKPEEGVDEEEEEEEEQEE